VQENELRFLYFLENAMNSLSKHVALSEFISTHCIEVFFEELAKQAYCPMRVHPLRMNTHPLVELLMAKRG